MRLLLIGQGYVGAYLTKHLTEAGHSLTVASTSFADVMVDGETRHKLRYQDVYTDLLGDSDAILWFAGHSSVGKSIEDPSGAVRNNCFDLLELARRKPGHVPLIYASTASLYSVEHRPEDNAGPQPLTEPDARISSLNAYDSSKAAFDALIVPLANNTTGLRLGTVCGYSPRMREELVFNSMNLAALRNGVVNVANRKAWRSLLFLDDLAATIDALLGMTDPAPRFLNLASIDTQIGTLADDIAAYHGAVVREHPNTSTYSFRMDTTLMHSIVGPRPTPTITERCAAFKTAITSASGA